MSDRLYWYHNVLTTYGAWLPGDPRGFRTRHHREHVEGDYKNPPPAGKYEDRFKRSQELLKAPPVVLSAALREVVGVALCERLEGLGALVLCVAVAGQHLHVLSKMPFGKNRWWIGLAKRHVWFVLREQGWSGRLWGKGCKMVVINDRRHQLNAYYYILRHAARGAWSWTLVPSKK
jgi:hypothetical protein